MVACCISYELKVAFVLEMMHHFCYNSLTALKEKHEDWPAVLRESLKSARTVPSYLLDIVRQLLTFVCLIFGLKIFLSLSLISLFFLVCL